MEIIFLPSKTASFGRKTISEGISKADQGSFAPDPTAAMPGQIIMSIFRPIIWLKIRHGNKKIPARF